MDRSALIAQLRAVPLRRRVITALDVPAGGEAVSLAAALGRGDHFVKVGLELFSAAGPDVVEHLRGMHRRVFLDLKYHDIPNTVAAACAAAADLGVWMVNVHCSGGARMIATARDRLDQFDQRPLLIGVTVLTSLDAEDLAAIGCPGDPAERVLRLAELGRRAGLNGVVCSPREAAVVRANCGADFVLVTPGVRPPGVATGDQKRVMTPSDAIAQGADYLVIGRPITAAPDPMAALEAIEHSLGP